MSTYLFYKKLALRLSIASLLLNIVLITSAQISFPGISVNQIEYPDTTIKSGPHELYLDPALPDVKSIGKGMTSVTGWKNYNGMLMNPAFLSESGFSFELADAQVTIPKSTTDAISYIQDHKEDMSEGRFLKELKAGINNYRKSNDPEKQQEGLEQIYNASKFGDEMLTNVIGQPNAPIQHGFIAFPNFKAQYKNFGLSLYNTTIASFYVTSGDILNLIRDIHRLKDEDPNEDMLIRLSGFLYNSYSADGQIDSEALPIIYSLAVSSTALTFGYGKQLNEKLSVGGNLHLYRRALSMGIIEAADYNEMVSVALEGFNDPVYDINLTAGAEYKQNEKLSFGLVAANFLPSKSITQTNNITLQKSKVDYSIIGESWRDSVSINLYSREAIMEYQYILNIPFILSIGGNWQPLNKLYLSAEIVDVLNNDKLRYEDYSERIRLGAEYSILNEIVSFRAGFANLKPTIGGGISIPIKSFSIDLDAAYAHTKTTNTFATYIQLKVAYNKF